MLKFAELPRWMRRTLAGLYFIWAWAVTMFTATVVIRVLHFDGQEEPTIETIILLGGLLIAPLLPFAQRLLFPGGGGVDFNAEHTRESGRRAGFGIEQAVPASKLPPLGFESEEERE